MTTLADKPPAVTTRPESDPLLERIRPSLDASIQWLLNEQHPEGHWCAELEGDSILQSEYILTKWIIGEEADPLLPKIANMLREQQRPDGTWGQYPGAKLGGGKFDLSATVKGYFALKLMGDDINAPHMAKARKLVIDAGGAHHANTFSKFYLAALGQISYDAVPIIPPQIIYLPRWFYFHMTKVAAWTRTMIVPLSIVTMHRPVRRLDKSQSIDELFTNQEARERLIFTGFSRSRFWTGFFLTVDRVLKVLYKARLIPLREAALKRMTDWLVLHCKDSDGPGAIFPPLVYLLIALLNCRGYAKDHPVITETRHHLSNYMIFGKNGKPRNKPEDATDDTIRLQPCESVIWDTGIAAYALVSAGLDHRSPALKRCSDFLVGKEVRRPCEWTVNMRHPAEPSGWCFEYNNPWYPDVDDTVMVTMALHRIGTPEGKAAAQRAANVVLALQNDDGGWAAFDRTKDRPILESIPFADHNAMQDPSCADITGRTLECLGNLGGYDLSHPAVQRAIAYIRKTQEPEGCWYGRWGVNYIYGCYQVLVGLRRIGVNMNEPWVLKASAWLKSVQKPDGSWGETVDSYEDRNLMGQGESTASQTAWATLGLMAIHGPDDPAVTRGVEWLAKTQTPAGTWDEPWFTGTGFPKVFYLRYHLYRHYFPVMCLGRWSQLKQGGRG